MIDVEYAEKRFRRYLNDYDETDDKIKLKLIHTGCVLDAADEICRREGFSEEDRQLAVLIALLHDIGRFEQLREFHSFDDTLMNHADFGVKDTERLETLFDVPEEVVAIEEISPCIMERIRAHQCIVLSERVTHMDFWVSYLAFIFDLNFSSSFYWIEEHDYLNRNINRISYTNPKTIKDMEEIRQICSDYIASRKQKETGVH